MALDNPQLKAFCNNELRQIADKCTALKIRIDLAIALYNTNNIGSIINEGGPSNLITDGATDGRSTVTGGDVFNLVTAINRLQDFFNGTALPNAAPDRMDVIHKWQVNGIDAVL